LLPLVADPDGRFENTLIHGEWADEFKRPREGVVNLTKKDWTSSKSSVLRR
jgi:hypothetical protein